MVGQNGQNHNCNRWFGRNWFQFSPVPGFFWFSQPDFQSLVICGHYHQRGKGIHHRFCHLFQIIFGLFPHFFELFNVIFHRLIDCFSFCEYSLERMLSSCYHKYPIAKCTEGPFQWFECHWTYFRTILHSV
jgi:hypothetical protein